MKKLLCAFICLFLLSACGTTSSNYAADNTPVPPGHYRVVRGDNLYRIGLKFGQRADTLAAWNNLPNADQIEVGQVLRVTPPEGWVAPVPVQTASPAAPVQSAITPNPADSAAPMSGLVLAKPIAAGSIAQRFGGTSKGIDYNTTAGTAVLAAADGEVVYADDKLRGYGRLILIRHDRRVMTAYAHNSRLLAAKGKKVRRGEKIAEAGTNAAGKAQLHFELRIDGKAVDPQPYLQ